MRRQGRQESGRVLQRIGRSGQSFLHPAHRFDGAGGGASSMQGFGHGAEIGHQATGHAGRQGDHMLALLRIQAIQVRHCGTGTDGAQHRRGVPAFQMVGVFFANKQFSPHLVANQIRAQSLITCGIHMLTCRQHGRHQDRAGVPAQGHIVKIQCMACGGVDQGGIAGTGHGRAHQHRSLLSG